MIFDMSQWYISGLHFECQACGNCCSGPQEGFIWVTKPEIEFIARFLKMSIAQLRKKFFKRIVFRTTIIEHPATKDCIFLDNINGQKKCRIYPVRPNQCRTWPFWPSNLSTHDAWNSTLQKCPGINRGRFYSFGEIEKIKRQKKWWDDDK